MRQWQCIESTIYDTKYGAILPKKKKERRKISKWSKNLKAICILNGMNFPPKKRKEKKEKDSSVTASFIAAVGITRASKDIFEAGRAEGM